MGPQFWELPIFMGSWAFKSPADTVLILTWADHEYSNGLKSAGHARVSTYRRLTQEPRSATGLKLISEIAPKAAAASLMNWAESVQNVFQRFFESDSSLDVACSRCFCQSLAWRLILNDESRRCFASFMPSPADTLAC